MRFNQAIRGRLLAGGVLATALALPAQAHAQDAAAEADAGSNGGLEEIVVTAQRREERLQDVPIAVSAISAAALEAGGVGGTRDIALMIPSVQFTRSGPSGLFFVRGVGTTNAAAGEEGANAFYVDGVYIPDLGQTISNFNSVARVEVLKGPQGTLFGRNAFGGLVHIITRDPGDEFAAKGQIGYSNYNTLSGQAYFGGPLAEGVAMDLAITGSDQGKGWGRNVTRDEETRMMDYWGVRSKLVIKPSDSLKITFSGDYNRVWDNTVLAWRIAEGTLGRDPAAVAGFPSPGGQDTSSNDPALTELKIWGASATIEADLGFGTVTSISAIRDNQNHSLFDVDSTPAPQLFFDYVSGSRSYQEELRIASHSTDPLSWQVGMFYLKSIATNNQKQFVNGALAGTVIAKLVTDSISGFGEATYAVTPTTHLTAGVRYTSDKRTFTSTSVNPAPLSYGEFTYRFALRQDITDDVNFYASINRGFKAGLYSLQNPAQPQVRPEFIMAYEVGLKSELLDRRLRLNLAAYHYDISDYQVRSVLGGTTALFNAGSVKVDGIDVDFEAAPTDELRVFGGFSILNSRFTDFAGGLLYSQIPVVGGVASTPAALTGNKTPLAPTFTLSLGATYTADLGDERKLIFNGLFNHNSGYAFEPDTRQQRQAAFDVFNGSIEFRLNRNFGVEVWAKNLGNEKYFAQKITTAPYAFIESQAAPRTYGINLKFEY
jgi:iron complex outermembrane receptor protein